MRNSFISSFENRKIYKIKISHVLLFLLFFAVSFTCCEIINNFFVIHLAQNFVTLKFFEEEKNNIKILLYGDSHFVYGIDKRYFRDDTFNLSFNGASYIQLYYLLKYYIPKAPSLKYVVLGIDFNYFSSVTMDRNDEHIFWDRFIDYAELTRIKGSKAIRHRFYISLLDSGVGRKSFLANLRNFIIEGGLPKESLLRNKEIMVNGFVDSNKAFRSVEYHFSKKNVFDRVLLVYFEKILQLCAQHDILVITMLMPASKDYIKYAEQYITKSDLVHKILENPHYAKLIYKNFDYLDTYINRDDFFIDDGDHLDVEGGVAFSKLFSTELYNHVK